MEALSLIIGTIVVGFVVAALVIDLEGKFNPIGAIPLIASGIGAIAAILTFLFGGITIAPMAAGIAFSAILSIVGIALTIFFVRVVNWWVVGFSIFINFATIIVSMIIATVS